MKTKNKVYFFFEVSNFSLTNRTELKRFIESVFKKEKKQLKNINYIFVSDKKLLEINRQFLKHDFFTDIITFDLSTNKETEAEVYISIDRVKDNAKNLNTTFKSELLRVIFHGALHLCGFKDKQPKDIKKMREKEEEYLSRYLG